jgi:hypothetical protein
VLFSRFFYTSTKYRSKNLKKGGGDQTGERIKEKLREERMKQKEGRKRRKKK